LSQICKQILQIRFFKLTNKIKLYIGPLLSKVLLIIIFKT
jgi:hypothetical protein